MNSELGVGADEMALHRLLAQKQDARDLAIGLTHRDMVGNLILPRRKCRQPEALLRSCAADAAAETPHLARSGVCLTDRSTVGERPRCAGELLGPLVAPAAGRERGSKDCPSTSAQGRISAGTRAAARLVRQPGRSACVAARQPDRGRAATGGRELARETGGLCPLHRALGRSLGRPEVAQRNVCSHEQIPAVRGVAIQQPPPVLDVQWRQLGCGSLVIAGGV
jgi:hypothetical protein